MDKSRWVPSLRSVIPSPGNYEDRVSRSIARLRVAIENLVQERWNVSARSRATLSSELAVKACKDAGNPRAAKVAQAILALSRLGTPDVLPIEGTLREKLFELLGMLRELTRSDVA